MPRNEMPFEEQFLEQLFAVGRHAPSLEQKAELIASIWQHSPEAGRRADLLLLERYTRLQEAVDEARDNQEKLKELLEKLSVPPWHPAVFVGPMMTTRGLMAVVAHGSSRRVVGLSDDVEVGSLAAGDEVLLSNQLNVIMAKSPLGMPRYGETALFERAMEDGRLLLKSRDEQVVVDPAGALKDQKLTAGDLVRWDKTVWMAYEKVERSQGSELFLEATPSETFENVGGLGQQIELLQRAIAMRLDHMDIVRKYCLRPRRGILFVGPPGTGKTMLARAFANWVAKLGKSGRSRFIYIKPSGLNSMWYSQSEANYREVFRAARQAGQQEPDVPVVMFFDEVDATGAARGESLMRVDDRVLQAFMAELDGLEDRGNILVLAASNRRDAIDPALLRPGRLGDLIIEVPRPNMQASRDIFAKHLPPAVPYASNGRSRDQAALREEIIESAASAIFASNGNGELATITFRDGKRHAVRSSDLVSGAVIEKIAQDAIERASVREINTGRSGLQLQDVLTSICDQFQCAAGVLTPRNCRRHLTDLPQDVDVVSVEPVARKVRYPHRYLNPSVT